jgi:hypothetical protein
LTANALRTQARGTISLMTERAREKPVKQKTDAEHPGAISALWNALVGELKKKYIIAVVTALFLISSSLWLWLWNQVYTNLQDQVILMVAEDLRKEQSSIRQIVDDFIVGELDNKESEIYKKLVELSDFHIEDALNATVGTLTAGRIKLTADNK